MIEIRAESGEQLNLIDVLDRHFDQAYEHAKPTYISGSVHFEVRRRPYWLPTAVFAVAAAVAHASVVAPAVFGSVMATYLFQALGRESGRGSGRSSFAAEMSSVLFCGGCKTGAVSTCRGMPRRRAPDGIAGLADTISLEFEEQATDFQACRS